MSVAMPAGFRGLWTGRPMRTQVLDVLGDAVPDDRAADLLREADGSPRRAVNAFFDQSKGNPEPASDDVQSSPAQTRPPAEPAAKQTTGKRKAPAAASSGNKAGAGGGGKRAKQQQSDANQRSITAFFTRSPSGKAAAPVPVHHRQRLGPEAADPPATVGNAPRAIVKQEVAAEQMNEVCANIVRMTLE